MERSSPLPRSTLVLHSQYNGESDMHLGSRSRSATAMMREQSRLLPIAPSLSFIIIIMNTAIISIATVVVASHFNGKSPIPAAAEHLLLLVCPEFREGQNALAPLMPSVPTKSNLYRARERIVSSAARPQGEEGRWKQG